MSDFQKSLSVKRDGFTAAHSDEGGSFVFDKPSIEAELVTIIRDLERQETNEHRAKFSGECKGMIKALWMVNWLDQAEWNQWTADAYQADLQSAKRCAAAGNHPDVDEVNRTEFQLRRLSRLGVTPRAEWPQ
jgi:hypothetical protein